MISSSSGRAGRRRERGCSCGPTTCSTATACPVNFARALGEDFSFAMHHGLIGTDFDSLTGQYSAPGPEPVHAGATPRVPGHDARAGPGRVLRRLRPGRRGGARVLRPLGEVSSRFTDEQAGHWSTLYRDADAVFTETVMAEGKALLEKAEDAARGDEQASRRVEFLHKGLDHAELVLATQRAYREYKRTGDLAEYGSTLKTLDDFRARNEGDLIANMAYLSWSETYTWDRELVKLMATPGQGTARHVATRLGPGEARRGCRLVCGRPRHLGLVARGRQRSVGGARSGAALESRARPGLRRHRLVPEHVHAGPEGRGPARAPGVRGGGRGLQGVGQRQAPAGPPLPVAGQHQLLAGGLRGGR